MEAHQFLEDIPRSEAVRAFDGTSFSPEKRADNYRRDYAETMAADYKAFAEQAAKGGTQEQVDAAFARYRAGYATRFRAWLNSHSRCVSSFIVGPARFPVGRAQKWSDAADRRMAELLTYRERVRRAILRDLRPDLRPIRAGDADAIERLGVELASLERKHALMKQANAEMRKHAKGGREAQMQALVALGFSPSRAAVLVKPDCMGDTGFPGYHLNNSSANIRRVRERLAHLEDMHGRPVQEQQGQGVRMEEDPPANRVRLFFDGKPDASMRERLKSAGYRWAPSIGAWQGYINHRTMAEARTVMAEASQEQAPEASHA